MLKSFYLQKCYKLTQAIALTAKYTIMSNQEIFTKVVMYNNLKKKSFFNTCIQSNHIGEKVKRAYVDTSVSYFACITGILSYCSCTPKIYTC